MEISTLLLLAALFIVAAEVGAILIWDEAIFFWVLVFYPGVTVLGFGLFDVLSGDPIYMFGGLLREVVVMWLGFCVGSAYAAWRISRNQS
jgi:hypothetical protein